MIDTPTQRFESNTGIVSFMLGKVKRHDEILLRDDELRQIGLVALWAAANQFDADAGVKFVSYASKAVFNAMVREVEYYTCGKRHCTPTRESELDIRGADGHMMTLAEIAVDRRGLDAKQARRRVGRLARQVLSRIPERWRYAARRRHIDGASWGEIAAELGKANAHSVQTQINSHWRDAMLRGRGVKAVRSFSGVMLCK